MTHQLSEKERSLFNKYFAKGNSLSENILILKGTRKDKISSANSRKAQKAIDNYMKCLEILPNHWQTKWLLAKLFQAINQPVKALNYFEEALDIEDSNCDIAREASISAMDAGYTILAVKYSLEAIKRQPNDAGLMCNHALNLIVNGNDKEAKSWILKAIEIDSNDPINQKVYSIINQVINGKIARPKFNEL